jgi:tetratricopeptide (TPR) repeat protein
MKAAVIPNFNYYHLGKDLLENRQPVAAQQALDEAISRGQCIADAYYLRGKLHLDNQELDKAQADFRKALHNQTSYQADCRYLLEHVTQCRRREAYFRAIRRSRRSARALMI